MASSDPNLEDSFAYFDKSQQFGTVAETLMTVIGGLFVLAGAMVAAIGDAAAGLVVTLLNAFGVGGKAWIFAFTRDPARFLGGSFQLAGDMLASGAWRQLGPFIPILATASALGTVYLVTRYLDEADSDVPGLGINIPFVENEEQQGDEEDA